MSGNDDLKVTQKLQVPQAQQNLTSLQGYDPQDQLSEMLSGTNKYAPIVSSAKTAMWFEAQCGDLAGLRSTQANTIFAILDDFSNDYAKITTPAYTTTNGNDPVEDPVENPSANPVENPSADSVDDEKAKIETTLDELSELYQRLFNYDDTKPYADMERDAIQKSIKRLEESLDAETLKQFQETDTNYALYNDYINGKQIFEYVSVYSVPSEEISDPNRVVAMKQFADNIREEKIANPKQGSELQILRSKLETAKSLEEKGYKNVQGVGNVTDLQDQINEITSGKREAEIKQRMEEIEIYFVEKGKGIKVNDDINGFLHPILKSRQREYDNLYDELHNLY